MSGTKQVEVAMLTEHLRYTPITLLDDIINTVNELVNRAIDAAEEGLLAARPEDLGFPDAPDPGTGGGGTGSAAVGTDPAQRLQAEIEDGSHKLETLLQANVDKNFDKLELFALQNILTVPRDLVPWVRLPHYDNVPATTTSDNPTAAIDATLAELRKLRETKKLHALLTAERDRNAALLTDLRARLAPTSPSTTTDLHPRALAATPSARALGVSLSPSPGPATDSPGPLTTHAAFALAQLPHLRALLTDLKPTLDAMTAAGSAPVRAGSAAEVRRAYVEGQGRRIVEAAGGGGGGGEEGLGRGIEAEEVEALEAWVGEGKRGERET